MLIAYYYHSSCFLLLIAFIRRMIFLFVDFICHYISLFRLYQHLMNWILTTTIPQMLHYIIFNEHHSEFDSYSANINCFNLLLAYLIILIYSLILFIYTVLLCFWFHFSCYVLYHLSLQFSWIIHLFMV
jgi:hypothetical protein